MYHTFSKVVVAVANLILFLELHFCYRKLLLAIPVFGWTKFLLSRLFSSAFRNGENKNDDEDPIFYHKNFCFSVKLV